jgi:hypothetical protein
MKARLLKDIRDPTGQTDEVIPAGTIVKVIEFTAEHAGNCFPLEAHEAEILLPTFDDLGFDVCGTGNGGAAYRRKLPDGRTALVTNTDGNWIPDEDREEAVLVGIYNQNGESESVQSYSSCSAAILSIRNDLGLAEASKT